MHDNHLEPGYEQDLATLLIGVDSLWGGDALHKSGTRHRIADTWTSGARPPAIYRDPFSAHLRKTGGVARGREAQEVNEYVKKYSLRDLPGIVKDETGSFDEDRRKYVSNIVEALELVLDVAVSTANKKSIPPFYERRRAATKNFTFTLIADPAPLREQLRESLAKVGYEVTPSRNLRETFIAYEKQRELSAEEISQRAPAAIGQLLELSRERLFPFLNGVEMSSPWKTIAEVPFDGHEFKTVSGQHFTGSSIYRGGFKGERPLLKGLFEYNTDHPLSLTNLHHLCSHEVVPGHYLNGAIKDLLVRTGKLGFEATIGTMCTSDAIFQEGWAQNTYELLYGSREKAVAELGDPLQVLFAFMDLQDVGKHNVSVFYQREKVPLTEVKQYIAEQCVQPDPIVEKLSGAWARHPIIGPMYGAAYHYGKMVVNKAIQDKGIEKVTQVGFHFQGLVDIDIFQRKMYRVE